MKSTAVRVGAGALLAAALVWGSSTAANATNMYYNEGSTIYVSYDDGASWQVWSPDPIAN